MNNFHGVSNTLFIPLEARIFVSQNFPEYFYDEKALSLAPRLADNTIRKGSSEYAFLASVARYYNTDAMTQAFLAKHKCCNIIHLGDGFETAYDRLNGKSMPVAAFYEVDLPTVIEARRSLLKTGPNEVLIGADMFDLAWVSKIDTARPSLLIASGVFQYFTEERILRLISGLQNVFANAELIFDATNQTGLAYANKYVEKTGNTDALMYFCVDNSLEFSQKANALLIEECPFFADAKKQLGRRLKLYTRIAMHVVDKKKRAVLLHLQIS